MENRGRLDRPDRAAQYDRSVLLSVVSQRVTARARPGRGVRGGAAVLAVVVALLGTIALGSGAAASASTRTWIAAIGNVGRLGSNGSATLTTYWTGSGRLELRLRSLTPGVAYPVTLYRGPDVTFGTSWSTHGSLCAAVSDGSLLSVRSVRPDRAGIVRTGMSLSPAQVSRLVRYPRNLAIVVGSGAAARCGGFAPQRASSPPTQPSASASPSASPSPSASASPSDGGLATSSPTAGTSASSGDTAPSPAAECAPWPAAIQDVLAVLSTPDGLCLKTYTAVDAPAFLRAVGAMYLPAYLPGTRPTIFYLTGARVGPESFVLTHEVCHAHQDVVAQAAGLTFGDWYRSVPGADFVTATGWTLTNGRWVARQDGPYGSPLEDDADTCAVWYDPGWGPHFLRRENAERFTWAQRWLPLPGWITPYRPPVPPADQAEVR